MTEIKFSLDGDENMPIYKAVDVHPERWNGWLVPIVTFETAKQIADDLYDPTLDELQASNEILNCIVHAKENLEETVDVGCGICWLEINKQG